MPTRKAEAEWKDNIAEGSGRLNGDEMLRIHKEVLLWRTQEPELHCA